MQEFDEDFYAILGVEQEAPPEEIRKAYLRLAKKLHPDRFPNDPEQRATAQREFAKVTRAHDIVGDAQRRSEYDTLRELKKNRTPVHTDAADDPAELTAKQRKDTTRMMPSRDAAVEDENINVKWANKHVSRADDLFRRKKYQEAETAMKEAIRLLPQEPRYHNKLAEIYIARGWKTLAMTEVQAALRANPKDNEAKILEAKIRALTKTAEQSKTKSSFLTQVKNLFSKKKS
ncbi:MAG: tetratricopeptide repeat protein [Candidatus Melainabacteria bacterium]|nr:MAG: tetratricopeptide repeat protein [Candidatus Melainabacteria bacterium]